MKGQLEDDLVGMEYEHTVILRPGLLMGPRYVFCLLILPLVLYLSTTSFHILEKYWKVWLT